MPKSVNTLDMELSLSRFFSYRKNLIVPNVSWGLGMHEVDLLVVSKGGYATEVEIKISRNDLKKDLIKHHKHDDERIKYLYFALPSSMKKDIEFVPEQAGILLLNNTDINFPAYSVTVLRSPQMRKKVVKLSEAEMYKLARLGTLRIWALKANKSNGLKLISTLKANITCVLPALDILHKLVDKQKLTVEDKKVVLELLKIPKECKYTLTKLFKENL